MAPLASVDDVDEEVGKLEAGGSPDEVTSVCSPAVVQHIQKLVAEVIGTFFVVFAGCGAVAINKIDGQVTFPGICVVWGLIVMVMVYSVGHISGAHFNPAVTIAFTILKRFPLKELPLYIIAQLLGSILSSCALYFLLNPQPSHFYGTVPSGSSLQSFLMEIIITFLLMFVISGVATDTRAIGELAGIAVGSTIMLNVFVAGMPAARMQEEVAWESPYASSRVRIVLYLAGRWGLNSRFWSFAYAPLIEGPISGASMNPARTIGPAIIMGNYKAIWVYMVGPVVGALAGGFAYNLIRFTDKPLRELTKTGSFLKSFSRNK